MTFNHLPTGIRFLMFLNRIKMRILVLVILGAYFSYWGNIVGIATSRVERVFKKHKKRLTFKHWHSYMTEPNAMATLYEPKRLSRQSTDKLSNLFVQIDRELQHGFSRQFVADCLIKMKLMDDGEELTMFLDASGHVPPRS